MRRSLRLVALMMGLLPFYSQENTASAKASAITVTAKSLPKFRKVSCKYIIKKYRPYWAPRGYKINCVNRLKGMHGITDFKKSQISILNRGSKSDSDYMAVIAHEWAHAESASWGNYGYDLTAYWVKLLGYKSWKTSKYVAADYFWNFQLPWEKRPMERYAEARQYCANVSGSQIAEFVPCSTMNKFLRYKKQFSEA